MNKERPILFSAPMVRAILAGNKTQTRRVIKPVPTLAPNVTAMGDICGGFMDASQCEFPNPYGQPGDRLWVRETFSIVPDHDEPAGYSAVLYAADGQQYGRNRPSIHMPREFSRILLEIVSVRVERLNEISDSDCYAEGIEACDGIGTAASIVALAERMGDISSEAKLTYATLWESINGDESWGTNPWVWVVEFKRINPSSGEQHGIS